MNALLQLLGGHEKDIGGGFTVLRVLPAAQRRSVGPFVFFDHFGPTLSNGAREHDVRPHPHIGLATVTYLLEGAMMHHDSSGALQRIEPGAINWMTAGRGIVHSERAPEDLRGSSYPLHGLQLWAALPQAHEEAEPGFSHTPAAAIPELGVGGAQLRLLIGSVLGHASPVPTLMTTLYLDIRLPADTTITLESAWAQEMALYAPATGFELDGAAITARQMAVLDPAAETYRVASLADAATRVMLIGGDKLDAPRFMWWNFVSSRKERIQQAADDWAAGRFPPVAGETEFIPLPEKRLV